MADWNGSESLSDVARRAIERTTLRTSALVDRDFIVRWVQPNVLRMLLVHPATLIGTSALDLLHPDDVAQVAAILEFEQTIDVSSRSSIMARSVRLIRVRCGDGSWRSLEASLSNQYDDPDVGFLLIDLQAPSQLNSAHRAIELTRLGANIRDVLDVILGELTAADPGGVAGVLFDEYNNVLATSGNAPLPWGRASASTFRNHWTVPMHDTSNDRSYGALHVWCALAQPHPLDLETADRIAGHASLVISRYRALDELRIAALRDPLTGLANRRALEAEINDRRQSSDVVLVAYIDLDHFKAINDRIGHEAGDAVLKITADRLRGALRSGDVIARMGGDEFVLLVTAPAPAAETLIARLQAVISQPMEISGELVSITATIGVSEGSGDPEELLRCADHAMLASKRGR